jgi:hypothetical protein
MCTHSEECAKAIGFNNVVSISPLLAEMAFGNNIWYTHHKAWIDNRSIYARSGTPPALRNPIAVAPSTAAANDFVVLVYSRIW